MDTPAPPLLSQGPETEPPSHRTVLSRENKRWLAIGAGVALVGVGLSVTLVFLFWPSRLGRTANPEAASGWVQLGKEVVLNGLVPANQDHDGATEPSSAGDLECHALQRYPGTPELYAYFR